MDQVLWIAQSFLISAAIFFLFEVEFAFDRHGGWQCFKVNATSAEYLSDSWNTVTQCCKMNKAARWQTLFGILAVVQTGLLIVLHTLGIRSKSPLVAIRLVCATCWVLACIVLSTKLVDHFSSQTSAPRKTTSGDYYMSIIFAFVSNAITYIVRAAFKRVSRLFARSRCSISLNEERDTFQGQELKDGWYFCASDLSSQSFALTGVNVSRALAVLIIAYVISSGYTLYIVLGHEESAEEDFKTDGRTTRMPTQSDASVFRERDNYNKEGFNEGNVEKKEAVDKNCATINPLNEPNKKERTVAFMEEHSDEESFVFGWRL
ncbi:uncharacterized protein [Montipora capricornis]|uniref:uncharacterized protein n=1 Tax=Montipora capricornis TaxID=246305 RepID=UPI0035F20E1E